MSWRGYIERARQRVSEIEGNGQADDWRKERALSLIADALDEGTPDDGRQMQIGSWVQDLLVHPNRDVVRITDDLLDFGLDAIGVGLYAPENGGDVQPFQGGEMSKVAAPWRRNMDAVIDRCAVTGATLWGWGWMFPTSRRRFEFDLKYHGREIPNEDCWYWRGAIVEPWLEFLSWVRQEYGDHMRLVDTVEPFIGGHLDEPPNRATAEVQRVWPGAYRAGVDEVHPNPGGEMKFGRVIAFDGWGQNTRKWATGDGRRLQYAGLPAGDEAEIVGWFKNRAIDAAAFGAEAMFVLNTTTWRAYSYESAKNTELQRKGIKSVKVRPWRRIYEALGSMDLPDPAPIGGDEVDLSTAVIASNSAQDVARWEVTSNLRDVRITPEAITLEHSKAGQWPFKMDEELEGNPWVGAQIEGRWHFGTYEWLRPGQTTKQVTAENIGDHVKEGPLANWIPRSGDRVAFFVSTLARLNRRTSNERSQVRVVRWP